MKILLNASGGNSPIHEPTLAAVKEIGLDGIRRDLFRGITSLQLVKITQQVRRQYKLQWNFLMNHIDPELAAEHAKLISRVLPLPNLSIEIGVEATLHKEFIQDPIHYAVQINHMAFNVWNWLPDIPIIVTTTSDISSSSQEFLKELIPFLDRQLEISVHTYRKYQWDPSPEYRTLEEMFLSMRGMLNNHRWHNTETGWHTATIGNLCKFSKWLADLFKLGCRLTHEEVGNYLVEEIKLHEAHGADSFTIYQAYNGKKDTAEDRYGILAEGTLELLPSARIVQRYIEERNSSGRVGS